MKCSHGAQFALRARTGTVTTCAEHLAEAASQTGQAVLSPVGDGHPCQVPAKSKPPFGFTSAIRE